MITGTDEAFRLYFTGVYFTELGDSRAGIARREGTKRGFMFYGGSSVLCGWSRDGRSLNPPCKGILIMMEGGEREGDPRGCDLEELLQSQLCGSGCGAAGTNWAGQLRMAQKWLWHIWEALGGRQNADECLEFDTDTEIGKREDTQHRGREKEKPAPFCGFLTAVGNCIRILV